MNAVYVYYGNGAATAVKKLRADTVVRRQLLPIVPGVDNYVQNRAMLHRLGQPTPDRTEAKQDILEAKKEGAVGVIVCHEVGAEHPDARAYLRDMADFCKVRALSPVVISSNAQNTKLARDFGCTVWREVWGMRPAENLGKHMGVHQAIGEALLDLTTVPRLDDDAILLWAVGQKVWNAADPWVWPTPTSAQLKYLLRELKRLAALHGLWSLPPHKGEPNFVTWKWDAEWWDTMDGLVNHRDLVRVVRNATNPPWWVWLARWLRSL